MLKTTGDDERFADRSQITAVLFDRLTNAVDIAERRDERQRARQPGLRMKQAQESPGT